MIPSKMAVATAADDAEYQCNAQAARHGGFHSLHEAMAKLREEFEEVWDICKMKEQARSPEDLRREAIQVAACAIEIAALADDPRTNDADRPWIRR